MLFLAAQLIVIIELPGIPLSGESPNTYSKGFLVAIVPSYG